jgi:hypothetical protein
VRSAAVRTALVTGLGSLSLAGAGAVHAQSSGGSSGFTDLVPVALWTLVVAVIGLSLVSVGYLYRRARGLDEPRPEVPIPPLVEAEAPSHLDAAGQPLPEHVVHEHAAARHDDATEQAELLHEVRH